MHEYLDRRYALALYEIGEEKGKVKEYLQTLEDVDVIINQNTDFLEVIKHPQLSTAKKKEMFTNVFKGRVEEDVLSFILLLIEKGRILELSKILEQMRKIDLERTSTLIARVITVVPLTNDERTELTQKLQAKYNKTIVLEEETDEAIIGGVYVKVGNDIIDGTIRGKYDTIRRLTLKRE